GGDVAGASQILHQCCAHDGLDEQCRQRLEAEEGAHQCTSSMRSTDRRARAATSGAIVTSWVIVSRLWRILARSMRFMCGHRLQERTSSTSGASLATLSLIEHSVSSSTRGGRFALTQPVICAV